jgi:hypothetical protein
MDVVSRYGGLAPDGVHVLKMAMPEHADEGCLCSAHATVSALLADIEELDNTVSILDLEASPEHLSRGTTRHVDALLLVTEPDFALAHFMLSVLGEGTFLSLLSFLERFAPDPVTRRVTHLALADEARHVAFGMAHMEAVLAADPGLRPRLATAVRRRHDALAQTAGLNAEVFDALVVLAAGQFTPAAIAKGFGRVQALEADMDDGRRRRLVKLGFTADDAAELAELHTKNFM